ncbi:MAG: hypothetical protein F6K65_22805 [Moorea sp. SIO3C2]|nr:hypothetical protein [Moorena sp. SIO3C2]
MSDCIIVQLAVHCRTVDRTIKRTVFERRSHTIEQTLYRAENIENTGLKMSDAFLDEFEKESGVQRIVQEVEQKTVH